LSKIKGPRRKPRPPRNGGEPLAMLMFIVLPFGYLLALLMLIVVIPIMGHFIK